MRLITLVKLPFIFFKGRQLLWPPVCSPVPRVPCGKICSAWKEFVRGEQILFFISVDTPRQDRQKHFDVVPSLQVYPSFYGSSETPKPSYRTRAAGEGSD